MTPSTSKTTRLRLQPDADDYRIAQLAALAICVHVLESALPSPIPGVKPGLANVISIAVYFLYGFRAALWVTLLRVLVGSLVIGSFLTPGFALSLAGSIATLCMLFVLQPLKKIGLGPVGAGVLAAISHITGQFLLAFWLFIPHQGLMLLYPPLLLTALVFGGVTGLISLYLLNCVENRTENK